MKTLIIYYSYSGNTKRIAKMLQEKVGGDIVEIDTVSPYEGDYNSVVEQGHDEVKRGYTPEIKPIGINLSDYDTVVLGTPVWWYTMAPAIKTFISSNDFSNKTVFPFATNGGWIGHTFEDIEKSMPGAKIMPGADIYFSESILKTPEKEITSWAEKIE